MGLDMLRSSTLLADLLCAVKDFLMHCAGDNIWDRLEVQRLDSQGCLDSGPLNDMRCVCACRGADQQFPSCGKRRCCQCPDAVLAGVARNCIPVLLHQVVFQWSKYVTAKHILLPHVAHSCPASADGPSLSGHP